MTTKVAIDWWDPSVPPRYRYLSYVSAGCPAIACAPVAVEDQRRLLDELRPYRVIPVYVEAQEISLDARGHISTIAESTLQGAMELAELDCVGDFRVVDIREIARTGGGDDDSL
jgi:hypothetical protein